MYPYDILTISYIAIFTVTCCVLLIVKLRSLLPRGVNPSKYMLYLLKNI